jgi:phosphate transport system substrate-binding protein
VEYNRFTLISCLVGLANLTGLQVARAEEIVKVSAGISIQESLFSKIEAPFEKEAGVDLVFVKSTNETFPGRLKDLIDGKVDAAVASISFDDWIKAAKKEGIEVPPTMDITHRVIGKDLIMIVSNKSAGVKILTADQVASVFTGKSKNWKEIGGADQQISILMATDKTAGRVSFVKLALKNEPITGNVKEFKTNTEMVSAVNTTPGAIAFVTTKAAGPNIVEIQTPVIGRPATMITPGKPTANVEKLINFIRKNGDALKLGGQ